MQSIHATAFALALAALACGAAAAPAPKAPVVPDKAPDAFAEAPADLKAFFAQAERADAITDPLARCLAYPDLPGNHWRAGLAKAHCELRYTPRITLAEMKGFIERGAYAELDARFAADLARHFDEAHFSEVIHRDFDDIDGGYEAGRLTQRWLDAEPESPWALAARAVHYQDKGGDARGGKYARETPDENFVRMREFDGMALDHYQRALAIEPRLMPAWIGVINVAKRSSNRVLERDAMVRLRALDAGCVSVARVGMGALEPRWGGSHEAMLEFAKDLEVQAERRPLAAIYIPAAIMDAADLALHDDQHALVVELLTPVAPLTTDTEAHENLASALQSLDRRGNRYLTLAHLLVAGRFTEGTAWANRTRGRILMEMRQPAWALRYLQLAASENPGDGHGEYLLAGALSRVGRHAESEAHYKLAMETPAQRQKALEDLVRAMLLGKDLGKAVPYAQQFAREFPADPVAWHLQGMALAMRGMSTVTEAQAVLGAWRKFVAMTADNRDAGVVRMRTQVQADIADIERNVLPKMRK